MIYLLGLFALRCMATDPDYEGRPEFVLPVDCEVACVIQGSPQTHNPPVLLDLSGRPSQYGKNQFSFGKFPWKLTKPRPSIMAPRRVHAVAVSSQGILGLDAFDDRIIGLDLYHDCVVTWHKGTTLTNAAGYWFSHTYSGCVSDHVMWVQNGDIVMGNKNITKFTEIFQGLDCLKITYLMPNPRPRTSMSLAGKIEGMSTNWILRTTGNESIPCKSIKLPPTGNVNGEVGGFDFEFMSETKESSDAKSVNASCLGLNQLRKLKILIDLKTGSALVGVQNLTLN